MLARPLLRLPKASQTLRAVSISNIQGSAKRSYSSHGSTEPSLRCARVPNRASVAVTGSQASTFLNGIITVSVPAPDAPAWKTNGGGIYSAFLSAQGRIMYDIFIYPYIPKSPDEKSGYIVEYDPRAASTEDASLTPTTHQQQASPKHPTPPLLSMMKRYILRSKVRVRDVSENWDVWALWGPGLPQSVKDIARPDDWRWGRSGAVEPIYHDAGRTPLDLEEVQNWSGANGMDALWMVDRRAPGMGIRALLPKGSKPIGSNDDVALASSDEYTSHRIQLGVPEGVDDIPTQDSFPMDANMDMMGGVDFRKGCYVGQELTVRTYHTGVVRKRIVPVVVESENQASSSPSGEATNAGTSTTRNPPPQTAVQGTWLSESPRPRPRAPGKLLSSTPDGHALALLRIEALKAAEGGEMRLFVNGADGQPMSISPRRPSWWPSETKEEEWTE